MSAPVLQGQVLVVTGAAGFLGRAIVAAARAQGLVVRAILRPGPGASSPWADDAGVEVIRLDLANLVGQGGVALSAALQGAQAVIHAAARLDGTEADHRRDTLQATEVLAGAVSGSPALPPRVVLAGSFAVYDHQALADGAQLTEESPTIVPLQEGARDPGWGRDAYARAKARQEAILQQAAAGQGFPLVLARIGVLYGPGRMWTSHLGFALAGRILCPGGAIPVPAIHVEDAAQALVAAAIAPDQSLFPDPNARLAVINLVSPEAPRQADWLRAIGAKRVWCFPAGLLGGAARLCDGLTRVFPGLSSRLPGVLHGPSFAARFKPLRYPATRAAQRLQLHPRPFPSRVEDARP